jgi:hypothetical protein
VQPSSKGDVWLASSGVVEIDGLNIARLHLQRLRCGLAIIPQVCMCGVCVAVRECFSVTTWSAHLHAMLPCASVQVRIFLPMPHRQLVCQTQQAALPCTALNTSGAPAVRWLCAPQPSTCGQLHRRSALGGSAQVGGCVTVS